MKVVKDGPSFAGVSPGAEPHYRSQPSNVLPSLANQSSEARQDTPNNMTNQAHADASSSGPVLALTKKRISIQRVPLAELNESLLDDVDES